jgi:transposase-like protein
MNCPRCKSFKRQVKNGLNGSGSQKYKCNECGTVYTPEPKENGYSAETRLLAIRMYVEGSSYRSIARVLKINPQSVANWVNHYTSKLPPAPLPNKVRKAELDELYTYVGEKKTKSMF